MPHTLRSLVLIITLLTLSATPSEARSPQGRHVIGILQTADLKTSRATVLPRDKTVAVAFVWNRHTVFNAGAETVSAERLKAGVRIDVIMHSPFFGEPFATKVTFLDSIAKN